MQKQIHTDEALPLLERAIHSKTMAPAFAALFEREYPGREIKITRCRVRQIYHKPGKSCKITYQISYQTAQNGPADQWIHGVMLAQKGKLAKYTDGAPAQWPGCGFWKPVMPWAEFGMVLYAFPYDPEMPNLGQLLESRWVCDRVTEQLAHLSPEEKWTCRAITAQPMKYRFGKSCLLRYRGTLENDAGQTRPLTFYGKTYNSEKSRYVFEALREICQNPACHRGELNIPAPLAHIDEANTLWQEEWPGENVTTVAKKTNWSLFQTPDFMEQVAALLAALHRIELTRVKLRKGPTPERVRANVDEEIVKILPFLPERAEQLIGLKDALNRWALQGNGNIPLTTIHGTFKLSQLLTREGKLGLVDFDSLALGDPLYDAAEFISSVDYLQISDELPPEVIRANIETFLRAYEQGSERPCDRQRLAFYVIAFLLGKIHSSLKKVETAAIDQLHRAFALLEWWQEAL